MRANAGYVFIVKLLVEGIRIETGLLHHCLHQRLLLQLLHLLLPLLLQMLKL